MSTLKVNLKNHPYKIIISSNENDFLKSLKSLPKISKILIITDTNIAKFHLKNFQKLIKTAGFKTEILVIKAGESSKSIKELSNLYESAVKMGLDRTSCVIAFGGGVIGDLAGFFAGTFMRGIKLVQAPTTLLAMADSSIGGKTAITTALAKNIAGTFKQPEFVWINPKFLMTLPQREIKNGMAEILKYAFTFDTKFYDYLVGVFQKGIITTQNFEHIIYKCCSYKASVVVKDEKDTKGIREILNFGHTLAHAIETQTKYKKFLHGEAVAIGALFAAGLSRVLGLCKIEVFDQVKVLLSSADLIFNTKGLNASDLVRLMKKDKKTVDGKIKFVLLKGLGLAVCGYSVADKKIETELKKFLKETDK